MKPKTPAVWKECNGAAHSNPMIDGCWVCIPFWAKYPVCPVDAKPLTEKGFCRTCHRRFNLDSN